MENVYSIWKTGRSVHTALSVLLVGETERALKFKVLDANKDLFFHLPKKAVKFDTKNEGIINLAHWFTVDDFLRSLLDRFATHFKR
jgi:hypothetical protein